MAKSDLEKLLLYQIRVLGIPEPTRELRFHPVRRWRLDMAWTDRMLAVEIQGGTWTRGRHTRPHGYTNDAEKYNAAQLAGWTVLLFTSDMVTSGQAVNTLEEVFRGQE